MAANFLIFEKCEISTQILVVHFLFRGKIVLPNFLISKKQEIITDEPFFYSSLQLLSRGGVISIGHRTHILALTLTTKITTVTSVRRRDETKRLNVYARLDFLNSRKQLSCKFN